MILEPIDSTAAQRLRTENQRGRVSAGRSSPNGFSAAMEDVGGKDSDTPTAAVKRTTSFWERSEFGFGDIVDIVNPLQHIPVVATIYRKMTGDGIGALPRVLGGALWGRLGGMVAGAVNAVLHWFTGKDIGDHVLALLNLDGASNHERSGQAVLSAEVSPRTRNDRHRAGFDMSPAAPIETGLPVLATGVSEARAEESGAPMPTPAVPRRDVPALRLKQTYAVDAGADASLLLKHRLTINA